MLQTRDQKFYIEDQDHKNN